MTDAFAPIGQLRTLLEPDEAHRPLLTAFLDATSNTRLAWINDVAIGRYEHATEALTTEASNEVSLAQKKVRCDPDSLAFIPIPRFNREFSHRKQILFSLSKLAQVAQVSKETIESESVQRAIEGI